MSSKEDNTKEMNGKSIGRVKQMFKDRTQKVAQTKEIFSKQAVQTKEILSKQAIKIAKQAEEHERFINKIIDVVTAHILNVSLVVPKLDQKSYWKDKREPWPQISNNAKSLAGQMLDPDPRKRLTAKQVLEKEGSFSWRSSSYSSKE